jgi:hypothetical protein
MDQQLKLDTLKRHYKKKHNTFGELDLKLIPKSLRNGAAKYA